MTLIQFQLITTAHIEREEDKWDRTAHIMSAVMNYGGMGLKEPVQAQDIFELRKHQEGKIEPITSWAEALELIERM